MGCCGGRDEEVRLREEQKWDYINLNDFTTKSCWIPISYMILYFNVLISLAVYALDTFTAVNLLAFSRWSSQIKPAIPLDISKWIFAGCIIFSLVLLIYRWLRAIRVINSGGIAQCYLDPIAVKVQSIRTSKRASGWRRFLVFAELTKSRKGADYVAIFTYFNFEGTAPGHQWHHPLLCRKRARRKRNKNKQEGTSAISQFFINIEALAEKDRLQALILFSMLFTLVIWAFEFISFCVSVLLYLLFLWHHIPSEDGTLSVYCRRKINRRLERIVKKKVDKALTNAVVLQDRKRTNTDLETGIASVKRNPTLPTLPSVMEPQQPKLPEMPPLSRQTTVTTLPPYRPQTSNTDRPPPLPEVDWDAHNHEHGQYDHDYDDYNGHDHDHHTDHGMAPSNSMHQMQYSDDASASLVNNAGGIGYSPPPSQYEHHPPQQQHYQNDPMQREYTKTPMLPPVERYGTPLSVSTAQIFNSQGLGQGRRTPGPMTPGPGAGPRTPGPMTPGPGPRTPGPLTPGPGSMGRQTPFGQQQQQQQAWDAGEVPDLPPHNPQPTLPPISRPGTAFAPPPSVSTPAPSFNRDRERERYGPYDGPQMSSAPHIPSVPTPTPSAPPTNGYGAPYRNFARPSLAPYSALGGQDMPPRSETAPLPSHSHAQQYSHSQVGHGQAASQDHGQQQQQPGLQQEPQLPQIEPPNNTQNGSYPPFNP
ncbi:hypothetical protein MGYG_07914 [Nannizzia gypsea CBS 118893]|uniref:Pheromone-regulated membrane protein 6 n=1 Tax=Arthroderma gypseum (strain ATCC MYA-4604 / CBS 118893) TaxID=535722 RepID=E4V4I8_ARTGP|nr:hypothetical protein MGYG_07914 [Nannizzia gypsea CBS 118893]EFR04912.1 hypothetical protein MGYG_07914 [Nannizzia gypsea CBS 118893]